MKPVKTAWAGVYAIIGALIVAGVVIGGMNHFGWPIFKQEKVAEAPPEVAEQVSSQWKVSPAANVLRKSLSSPPSGWEVKGNLLESPQ